MRRAIARGLGRVIVAVAAVGMSGGATVGWAETSSWQQRIAPVVPAPTKRKTKPTAVRSQPVAPGQAPSKALPGSGVEAAPVKSLGASTTSIEATSGTANSDPAYDAFDQGKYLTALTLAAGLAKQNDPQAHTLVARIHAEGLGVPRDPKLAAQWYQRGTELGDPEAALGLGTLYARGDGVERDVNKAAALFEKAAATGHAEGNYNLALMFLAGLGKPENPARGFDHMRFAAERGVTAAMYDLGTLYATGTGTTANAFEAAIWIGKAANAGYPEAEVDYAVILLKNHDLPLVKKDELRRRAVELLHSAATKGLVVAQNRLAYCYLKGEGVAKNATAAATWHLIARAGGLEDAKLDTAVEALSKSEREKALKSATIWRERAFLE